MRRSLLFESKKGQWFLISAILISSSLLSISLIYKNYFSIDSSDVARMGESDIVSDIENQLSKIVSGGYDPPNCAALGANLQNFKDFSESKLAERGYMLDISYSVDCPAKKATFAIKLVSERMSISRSLVL